MPTFGERLQHAWNAFKSRDPTFGEPRYYGVSSSYRQDRPRLTKGNERSIVTSVFNRIATDVSSVEIHHVRLDQNGRLLEIIEDGLENCLSLEANLDQSSRAFFQDAVLSMFDEGHVVLVPVDTTVNPKISSAFDVETMRTGRVTRWYPKEVTVSVYNEDTGKREEITLPKKSVAIAENPFYAVMNEPNSILQRLIRKLNLLDAIDEQSGSGKLDLIIQLPYVIKSEARKQQAENRRKDIEMQLAGSKYGIAYTDGTERITQLNRAVDNNLMKQIEYLTSMLHSQLGITDGILNGTADEQTMLNYMNRTVEPVLAALIDAMKRSFLSKTARSQHQSIMYFRDPFKLVPVNNIADIADKFTRNEILSSNEVRKIIGYKPVDDPKADELLNKNLSRMKDFQPAKASEVETPINTSKKNQNGTKGGSNQ